MDSGYCSGSCRYAESCEHGNGIAGVVKLLSEAIEGIFGGNDRVVIEAVIKLRDDLAGDGISGSLDMLYGYSLKMIDSGDMREAYRILSNLREGFRGIGSL